MLCETIGIEVCSALPSRHKTIYLTIDYAVHSEFSVGKPAACAEGFVFQSLCQQYDVDGNAYTDSVSDFESRSSINAAFDG